MPFSARTNEGFVHFLFVFQSCLLHIPHFTSADSDTDQDLPDKATALTALHVYKLLMEPFIIPYDTIYHIESHALQFYI